MQKFADQHMQNQDRTVPMGNQNYKTIVDVAAKRPEKVVQEDEKLLMYYHVATMRLGME